MLYLDTISTVPSSNAQKGHNFALFAANLTLNRWTLYNQIKSAMENDIDWIFGDYTFAMFRKDLLGGYFDITLSSSDKYFTGGTSAEEKEWRIRRDKAPEAIGILQSYANSQCRTATSFQKLHPHLQSQFESFKKAEYEPFIPELNISIVSPSDDIQTALNPVAGIDRNEHDVLYEESTQGRLVEPLPLELLTTGIQHPTSQPLHHSEASPHSAILQTVASEKHSRKESPQKKRNQIFYHNLLYDIGGFRYRERIPTP